MWRVGMSQMDQASGLVPRPTENLISKTCYNLDMGTWNSMIMEVLTRTHTSRNKYGTIQDARKVLAQRITGLRLVNIGNEIFRA